MNASRLHGRRGWSASLLLVGVWAIAASNVSVDSMLPPPPPDLDEVMNSEIGAKDTDIWETISRRYAAHEWLPESGIDPEEGGLNRFDVEDPSPFGPPPDADAPHDDDFKELPGYVPKDHGDLRDDLAPPPEAPQETNPEIPDEDSPPQQPDPIQSWDTDWDT